MLYCRSLCRAAGGDALWLHTEAGVGRRRSAQLTPTRLVLSAGVRHQKAGGMQPAGAYGAGKAGSVAFDPVAFFTHPRTVLRLLSWVSLPCTVWVSSSMDRPTCSPPLCLVPTYICLVFHPLTSAFYISGLFLQKAECLNFSFYSAHIISASGTEATGLPLCVWMELMWTLGDNNAPQPERNTSVFSVLCCCESPYNILGAQEAMCYRWAKAELVITKQTSPPFPCVSFIIQLIICQLVTVAFLFLSIHFSLTYPISTRWMKEDIKLNDFTISLQTMIWA